MKKNITDYDYIPGDMLSISNIRQFLGTSVSSVKGLCASQSVYKWAKYKPVKLRNTIKNDSFDNIGWIGANYTGPDGWSRPWWFGGSGSPVYSIPTISNLSDIGNNGIQNNEAVWIYNQPAISDTLYPGRVSDFAFYSVYEADKPYRSEMDLSIKLNSYFSCRVVPYESTGSGSSKGDYGFRGTDINKMIVGVDQLYVGVHLNNVTRGYSSCYVTSNLFGVSDEDGEFQLNVSSGSPISQGGMGFTVTSGDMIEVRLFLSPNKGATDFYGCTKYSALFDTTDVVYRRFSVGYDMIYIDLNYTCGKVKLDVVNITTCWTRNSDGSVFKVDRKIAAVYCNVTVYNSAASNNEFHIRASAVGTGVNSDGQGFTTSAIPQVNLYSSGGESFAGGKTFSINGNSNTFTSYKSQADAERDINGTTASGIPIYSEVVYNFEDGYQEGVIDVSSLQITCSGSSPDQYTSLRFNCRDGSNNTLFPN